MIGTEAIVAQLSHIHEGLFGIRKFHATRPSCAISASSVCTVPLHPLVVHLEEQHIHQLLDAYAQHGQKTATAYMRAMRRAQEEKHWQ
jgi:hypothetical protein